MSRKSRNVIIGLALLIVLALVVFLITRPKQEDAPVKVPEVTEVPTEAPTEVPTEAPTEAPTEEPTELPTEEPTEEPTETPAEAEAPVLLATVNGKEILSDDAFLMSEYQYYLQLAEQYGMDTSSEETLSLIRPYSMQGAINSYLILEKAAELGLDKITDEETAQFKESIQASWEEAVQYFIDMMGNVTETSTDEEKAAARADALAYIKENYGYEEESYIQASMDADIFNTVVQRLQAQIVGDNKVADEDIVEYFNALVQEDKETYQDDIGSFEFYSQYYGQPSYYTPEGYRGIIHILLKVDEELMNTWKDLSARLEEQQSAAEAEPTETEEPAADAEPAETPEPVTEEMVAAAEQAILDSVKETVDEINAKLEGGASFTDLIKEYGTDTGMQSESNLANGYMVHKDSILWDPAFKKAALELDKIGDVSKPVVGQYGVHILQYLKDIPGGPVELTDEMKEDFRATLQGELEDDLFQTAIEEWLAAATVEYTEAGEAWKLVPEEPAAETGEAPAEEAPAE